MKYFPIEAPSMRAEMLRTILRIRHDSSGGCFVRMNDKTFPTIGIEHSFRECDIGSSPYMRKLQNITDKDITTRRMGCWK